MYQVCHFSTMMLCTFGIGLGYNEGLEAIGPRDIFPTKVLFVVMNITQIYFIGVFVYSLMNGLLVTSEKSKKLTKIYVVILLLDVIAIVAIYFSTNQMEGQNQACIVWVKIRMVHYLMELVSLGEILR